MSEPTGPQGQDESPQARFRREVEANRREIEEKKASAERGYSVIDKILREGGSLLLALSGALVALLLFFGTCAVLMRTLH